MKFIHGAVASSPISTNKDENANYFAQTINTVVNDLTNSQYVLKDRVAYNSVMQTPVRQSLQQLRQLAHQLSHGHVNRKVARQANTMESQTGTCTPSPIVRDLLNFLNLCDFTCEFSLICHCDESTQVSVSESWLKQALNEVLINAIKHNSKMTNLMVSVSISVYQDKMSIRIEDNGRGFSHKITQSLISFSERQTQQIFAKYRQVPPNNLRSIQTHLQNNNGALEIKSARRFKTSVLLTLPTVTADEENNEQSCTKRILAPDFNNDSNYHADKLLVVRQQSTGADPKYKFALNILSEAFHITEAYSLEDGLATFEYSEPSCILIEAGSDTNNLNMLQSWLSLSPRFTLVPAVIIAENSGQFSQLDLMQSGISALLSKPIDYREVIDVIRNLLQEQQRFTGLIQEKIASYHLEKQDSDINERASNEFAEKFSNMLEQQYHVEEFNKVAAAEMLIMHEKKLSRKLELNYGSSFTEILRNFRLEKAKQMILMGESVTTTAYSTGFNTPSYFARCFKTKFGFTPSTLSKQSKIAK